MQKGNNKGKAAAKILQNSGVLNIRRFQKKMEALHAHCAAEGIFEALAETELPCPYGVFVSVGNPSARAVVMNGTGETPEAAWQAAAEKMQEYLKNTAFEARYVKVDLVDTAQWAILEAVNELLKNTRKGFFRYGVAFDGECKNAFLEEELNLARLVRYDEQGLYLRRINQHLLDQNRQQIFRLPDQVLVFSCQAVFCDEDDSVHTLCNDGFAYGRREIEAVDEALLDGVLTTSGNHLTNMVEQTGLFQSGFFADMNEKISQYPLLFHMEALWALLLQYSRNPNEKWKEKIDNAMEYAVHSAIAEINGGAFVVEPASEEIKLGVTAAAVIALVAYTEIMQSEKYVPLAKKLAEGILFCQNPEGDWWHILSYPEGERKEKHRTVYYDGEATFALAKLYGLTKEEKWLQAAQKAVDDFIRRDYTKYCDHWVAYSLNELTKYIPEERYFNFALQNAQKNIDRIYRRETADPTYLELLTASFETLLRMQEVCPQSERLQQFNEKQLVTTIYYRAQHMLAGYLYPEYAMYLKKPQKFIGSFCVRHHNFRVRIDDIGHFMNGYHHMLKNYETLEVYREKLGISPEDYMTLQEEE